MPRLGVCELTIIVAIIITILVAVVAVIARQTKED
jgi:hypothetical protein